MNSLERYMRTVKGEPVDFLPRTPILMQFAAEYIGSDYGTFASDYHVLVEANKRCAEAFGMDQVSAISDPYRETQGFGAEIEFIKDGVPKCVQPVLGNTTDLNVLKRPDVLKSERIVDRINGIKSLKESFKGKKSILGWVEGPAAEAGDLRGVSNFLMDLLMNPLFAGKIMDLCLEVGIEFAHAQLEAGADTIGIGDAIASQVSAELYNNLIQPREKQLVQSIKNRGGLVKLHICGNITHLLPGIADLGVDIIDVDHMVDVCEVRKAIGNRTVIAGNIDPSGGVCFGTPDAIRNEVIETYHKAGNPFIVNAGCEIPAGTPLENLRALCTPVSYLTRKLEREKVN